MKRQIIIGPDTKLLRGGGRPAGVILWLLVAQIGLFLVYAFADGPAWVGRHLAASGGRTVGAWQVYQLLTALWLHLDVRDLVFHSLLLWLLGPPLLKYWGSRRFLLYFVVTGAVGIGTGAGVGLLWPDLAFGGSGGAVMALLLGVAMVFPRHLLQVTKNAVLPLSARTNSLLAGGILLASHLMAGRYIQLAMALGGALAGLLILAFPRSPREGTRHRPLPPDFRVIDGNRSNGEKYLN